MIVIAGRLSLLGFVFKPVSWLAGDSRLRHTFSLRIHLVERQSLSSICPSTIISYLRSLAASLSTSTSRPITGPIVFSVDRNKHVTFTKCRVRGRNINARVLKRSQDQEPHGRGGQRPQREERERRVDDPPRQKPWAEIRGRVHSHDDFSWC